jgi:1-acyl-sn-glycerol-3-phosphate acyltransferase
VKKPLVRPKYQQNHNPPGRKKWVFNTIKFLGRIILTPFFRIQTTGSENLPFNQAFILLVKHQRWEDIPMLGLATPRPLYYIAKYELFKNVLSNWFFISMGGIPINRQRPIESRRFLQATIELLEKGEGVVVFPEGTYYRNKMGPGQTGMVRFVRSRLALPFVPVGINYSSPGGRILVRINFGKPAYENATLSADTFVNSMMEKIAQLSDLATH